MTRIMYDSTSAADIPRGALAVAGYVDGKYRWSDADWNLHSKALQVRITTGSGTLEADVADVERFDYTPTTGAQWLKRKLARDGYGALYFSLSQAHVVIDEVHRIVGYGKSWQVWVADWDGKAVLDPAWVGKQYADSVMVGHHYDLSIISDYWPGVDPPPVVTQPPPPSPGTAVPVAYSLLGDLLNNSLPSLIDQVALGGSKLGDF